LRNARRVRRYTAGEQAAVSFQESSMNTVSKTSENAEFEWFYDFVSPFSYLQLKQFERWPTPPRFTPTPVVVGAIFQQWGTQGPAELTTKRTFTYRHAHFRAQQLGLAYRMPPAHPFNPIKALRLAIAAGGTLDVAGRIFDFVWGEGRDPSDPAEFEVLCARVGVTDPAAVEAPAVKLALRANTERAIALGVFGVPTSVLGGELFWGDDAGAMLQHCLRDPAWLADAEVRRISQLPVGVRRG
jgi:2-hydroxychromene-2-carboxylate isomerase